MTLASRAETIDISPGVRVFSLFQHLNYRPWYALAELVDNSLQSFLTHRMALEKAEGKRYKLVVKIGFESVDGGRITVRDNAAGIDSENYQRAFKTASPPTDKAGLSQFGVGMKSAACWFARSWSVRSTALGEEIERFISFDVAKIVSEGIDTLAPEITPARRDLHFTEITLTSLHSPPQTRTISKIRDHLASIYRVFLREGLLEIWFNNEALAYLEPKVLVASYARDTGGEPREWRKLIEFDFGHGQRVHGFAAIRETASTAEAGFALFNHQRLIVGSKDEGHRPTQIFGRSNSYTYQRLFGELHLEGFEVTHTKDGFRLDQDDEEVLLDLLHEHLDSEPLPLLKQAEAYRVKAKPNAVDLTKAGDEALDATVRVIQDRAGPVLEEELGQEPHDELQADLGKVPETSHRTIDVTLNGRQWQIDLELTRDPAVDPWIELADNVVPAEKGGANVRLIQARLAVQHPFMIQFAGTDREKIEPLLRVAAALVLAETVAREGGVKLAGTIRGHINTLLRRALSEP